MTGITVKACKIAPNVGGDFADGKRRDLLWYRNMWLSNRNFAGLFETAIRADPSGWPSPSIIVNGMSANSKTAWDMTFARRMLAFSPQDDLFATVGLENTQTALPMTWAATWCPR